MPMTTDTLASKVEILEKQVALLMGNKTEEPKKSKKDKKTDSDDASPKKKRTSGYLLYSSATREEVRKALFGDDKPKNSEIMVELGKRWKALEEDERGQWNAKATKMKEEAV